MNSTCFLAKYSARTCGLLAILLVATASCSNAGLVDVPPPSEIVDPGVIQSSAAALQFYNSAVSNFDQAFGGTEIFIAGNFVLATALLTDELLRVQFATGALGSAIDERTGSGGTGHERAYAAFHISRVMQSQAREALGLYAPNAQALRGHTQSLQAYAILWLAELFCSGVPLSSASLDGRPNFTAGLSTEELLTTAIVLFDSAIVNSADSANWVNLARVGKGRALLGLGRLSDAAGAVQAVPTGFVHYARFGFAEGFMNYVGNLPQDIQVVDGEGTNGLTWSTDPRTAVTTTPELSGAMQVPGKYSFTSLGTLDATVAAPASPIRLADGLEARLIEAEADLAAGNSAWLTTLNTLRSTCVGTASCAPVPNLTATSLTALSDPGAAAGRLDLLFRERAMWLYLTGHRQGDLRRLARVYNRDPTTLWPTGVYSNAGFFPEIAGTTTHGTQYGPEVVFASPASEKKYNALYQGCFNLDP